MDAEVIASRMLYVASFGFYVERNAGMIWIRSMLFNNVCLEAIGYVLPPHVVTSSELETWLAPVYQRLRLPEGRLELITGVSERRFWAPGTLPSQMSIVSGQAAIEAADIDPADIGALIHASVCRDHLEPATACAVHHGLNLPSRCTIFDLSNACLGILNGIAQVANMIELGQIQAGLVVGTEGSRQLVETTVETLNSNTNLTRKEIKSAVASLTIGSGSCAMLLAHRDVSKTGTIIRGTTTRANTQFHTLCQSGADEAVAGGMQPLMETDSELLMEEGINTGRMTFHDFLEELSWKRDDIDKTVCHQVGPAHRKQMFERLDLETDKDFMTVHWLGNTGSVALPLTLARAVEANHVDQHDRLALLGIGSGINCVMTGCEWNGVPIRQADLPEALSCATP